MQTRHRLALVAFLSDLSLYLVMTALPFRVLALGGGPLALGLIPALYAAPYALLVLITGRHSDRGKRARGIRIGVGIACVGAVLLSRPASLGALLATIPVLSVGLSLVWPAVQAAFSELDTEGGLSRGVRLCNLSWSSGKSVGFLAGGLFLAAVGSRELTVMAATTFLLAALVVPRLATPQQHEIRAEGNEPLPGARTRKAFRNAAWIANGLSFGVGATLNHHYPTLLREAGSGTSFFGLMLGLVYLSQTISFIVLSATPRWHYRVGFLLMGQLAVATLALLLPVLPSPLAALSLAPLLGASMGFSYQSSLYYSLHSPSQRGRRAGIHESTLGFASAGLPLLGGAVAQSTGDLRAPFAVAAAAVVLSAAYSWGSILRARHAEA